jgi:hypothetical protein
MIAVRGGKHGGGLKGDFDGDGKQDRMFTATENGCTPPADVDEYEDDAQQTCRVALVFEMADGKREILGLTPTTFYRVGEEDEGDPNEPGREPSTEEAPLDWSFVRRMEVRPLDKGRKGDGVLVDGGDSAAVIYRRDGKWMIEYLGY